MLVVIKSEWMWIRSPCLESFVSEKVKVRVFVVSYFFLFFPGLAPVCIQQLWIQTITSVLLGLLIALCWKYLSVCRACTTCCSTPRNVTAMASLLHRWGQHITTPEVSRQRDTIMLTWNNSLRDSNEQGRCLWCWVGCHFKVCRTATDDPNRAPTQPTEALRCGEGGEGRHFHWNLRWGWDEQLFIAFTLRGLKWELKAMMMMIGIVSHQKCDNLEGVWALAIQWQFFWETTFSTELWWMLGALWMTFLLVQNVQQTSAKKWKK